MRGAERTDGAPIRVVLAEDDLFVREGLREVLATRPGVDLVCVCGDAESLAQAVAETEPDVVVTDIRMPPSRTDEGIRFADEARERLPELGVVVLSQYDDASYALRLFGGGSEGRAYLLKERIAGASDLVGAIESVAAKGSVIDSKVVDSLIAAKSAETTSQIAELTAREREVLAHIAEGKSNAAIAEALFLTKHAVEKHINSIFMKLGLNEAENVSKRVKAALIFLAETSSSADGPGH